MPTHSTVEPLVVRIKDVSIMVGLSVPAIHHRYRSGDFPKPIKLGERAIGWRVADLEAWVAARERLDHDNRAE